LESLIHFVANTTRRILQTGATNQRNTGAGMLDLEDLKTRLAEYDPAAPKCRLQIAQLVNYAPDHIASLDAEYHDYDGTTYVPCCRPEGHEGECRNARSFMGWPGFQTVSQLVAEVERLRELLLNAGWPREADDLAVVALQYERAAVVAWLRAESRVAGVSPDERRMLAYVSSHIERGDHRRKEIK
jgi:hypothetical protein